jgi:hypothetical protein
MKWFYSPLALLAFFFISCSDKEIVYVIENNKGVFAYQTTREDTIIKDSISIWTMDLTPRIDPPIGINFIYSEDIPNVEKLKSIRVSLKAPDDNGNYVDLPYESELDVEYYDGKHNIRSKKKNNTAPLNTLVDWKKVSYTYTFADKEYKVKNNRVTYTFSYDFKTEEYPDNLKLEVLITWENGERKYESVLTKKEYTGPKLSLKI